MSRNSIDQFLISIDKGAQTGEGQQMWPLLPAQMTPYFEVEQALEVYDILNNLRKSKTPLEIAKIFKYPGLIRNFMRNCGLIGLKVAYVFNVRKINIQERVEYFKFLVELLSILNLNDPFCLDDKNIILSQNDIDKVYSHNWIDVNDNNRRDINSIHVSLFSWIWSTYFNAFNGAGLEPHGLYSTPSNLKLLVRSYHGSYCPEVWPLSEQLPFRSITLYQEYKTDDIGINFENQITSDIPIGQYITRINAEIDGQIVADLQELQEISTKVDELVAKQTKFVKSLSQLDQVKLGAKISYYSLKRIYDAVKKPWWNEQVINDSIDRFKDEFIERFKNQKSYSKKYFEIINDPSNNLLGEEALKAIS